MFRTLGFLGIGVITLAGSGCQTNTGTGAAVGGGVGALFGGLVGAASGNPLAGAAIGAGAGSLLGAGVGSAEDRREERHKQAVDAYHAQNPPMSVQEVIQMSQSKVPDQTIINQIQVRRSQFNLTSTDLIDLQQQGVSQGVIQFMQTYRSGPVVVHPARPVGRVVYVEDPYYYPPPPPIGIGIGFGVGHHHHHRRY